MYEQNLKIEENESTITALQTELSNLKERFEANSRYDEMNQINKEDRIKSLESQIEDLKAEVNRKNGIMDEKAHQIEELQSKVMAKVPGDETLKDIQVKINESHVVLAHMAMKQDENMKELEKHVLRIRNICSEYT